MRTGLTSSRPVSVRSGRSASGKRFGLQGLAMQQWEKRYRHEKAVREALIKCGNKPSEPIEDCPYGTLPKVKVRQFNGEIYWGHMKDKGHSSSDFESCSCSGE